MLDDVRFVMAAVAKKAFVTELTHFRIRDGRITGYNGVMALSSSIGVDLDVRPNATKFLAAIRTAEGTISLHVTGAGKLGVRAGKFKAFVECLPEDASVYDHVPEGDTVELTEAFFKGIRLLAPVMGFDASRPWAMGIKVQEGSMYATNNVIVAQFWHACAFPYDVVIPAAAVDELLRIGEAPTRVQVTPTSVTFWFGDERWLKTNLLEGTAWPLARLDQAMNETPGQNQTPFPQGFFDDLETLKPFLEEDMAVYLRPTSASTSRDEGVGASVDVALEGAPELMAYSYKQLAILGQVATHADWQSYPRPCMFTHQGEALRGLIIGRVL